MFLRILGSAAGGGFPQWNCGCPGCRAVREGSRPCQPRTQSSAAVSVGYGRWFLLNASPDIRAQIESFPPLQPRGPRDTPIQAVLLTDAELDHTIGLLSLREGRTLQIHGTAAVRHTLCAGTGLLHTLGGYCRVEWQTVVPGQEVPLRDGLSYRAFSVPSNQEARFATGGEDPVIGYRLSDARRGRSLVYLPGIQRLTPAVRAELQGCDCLLFDGTCWHDDDLIRLGVGRKSAQAMGHLPIDGPEGSLRALAHLPIVHKFYIHINNTNPILLEDTPERRAVERYGLGVAADGLELEI